jgi:hypothetical protein
MLIELDKSKAIKVPEKVPLKYPAPVALPVLIKDFVGMLGIVILISEPVLKDEYIFDAIASKLKFTARFKVELDELKLCVPGVGLGSKAKINWSLFKLLPLLSAIDALLPPTCVNAARSSLPEAAG